MTHWLTLSGVPALALLSIVMFPTPGSNLACLKEALRLYPSVPIIARRGEKDVMIDGQLLEKGSTATVFVHLLHRNPLYWEKPEEFIPERFLENT